MATVTITLTDNTTDHTVSVHSSFTPAAGHSLSPAQVAGMEIMLRTTKQWGIVKGVSPAEKAAVNAIQVANYGATGVDIDAVHRQRDNAVTAR
jgi:uncharacterized membrane protein